MAKQAWEEWLGAEDEIEASPRGHLRSRYLDMLHDLLESIGGSTNLYTLAAYVVWNDTPKRLRVPKTQIELARLLGYEKDDVFRKWRKTHSELFKEERTIRVVEDMIMDRIADVVDASIECAVNDGAQGHPDRKMLAEIAKIYRPKVSQEVSGPEGKPLKTYTILANPDMWDDENDVETPAVASGAVEG